MANQQSALTNCGALWKNKSKTTGKNYLNGNIDLNGKRYPILIFANNNKTKENSPDYSITIDQSKVTDAPVYNRAPSATPQQQTNSAPNSSNTFDDDDESPF
jgi:uncharacterized protein (DUF736 family)